jgi:hypothetical protein
MASFEETRNQVAQLYSGMSDAELKKLADEAWSLTDIGKDALRVELVRRGLEFVLATVAPTATQVPSSSMVTLRQYRDLPEALLAKGVLESAGIESFLLDETTIRMDWLWSNLLGGVKLGVKPEDVDAAAQILNQEIPERFSVEGAPDFEQPRCPQCQSLDIFFEGLDKRVAYAGMLFVGFPIPFNRRRWKCQSCGYIWQPPDEPKQSA